jgi:hypothetical protein
MKRKTFKVITKTIKTPCYSCNEGLRGAARPRKDCKECNGTGIYKEKYYYFIDGKYAYDKDTLD